MTRSEMRTLVASHINRSDKTTLIDSALNLAMKDIGKRFDFREMRTEHTLSVGTDDLFTYLPTGWKNLLEVRLIDGLESYVIEIRPKAAFVARFPNPTSEPSVKPQWCYEEGGKIYFNCPFDNTYSVKVTVISFPTLASQDSAEPSITVGIDDALIAYATQYCMKSLGRHQEAQVWMQDYLVGLQLAINLDRRHPGTTFASDGFNSRTGKNHSAYDPFYTGDDESAWG